MQVDQPSLCLTAEGLVSSPRPGEGLGFLREKESIPTHLPIQACFTVRPDRLPNQKPS